MTTSPTESTITVRVLAEDGPAGSDTGIPTPDDADSRTESKLTDWIRRRGAQDIEVKEEDLAASLHDITSKLDRVLAEQGTAATGSGFRIEEFTVGLAISGKGKVVLVGELGVEASIEVTFKRQ